MGTTPGYVRPDWLDTEQYIFVLDRDSMPFGGSEFSWLDVPAQAIGNDSSGDGSNYFICTYYDDGGGRPSDRFAYHYASWRCPSPTVPDAYDSDTTEGYSIIRTLPGEQTYGNYFCEGDFQSWLHGRGAWYDQNMPGDAAGFRGGSQYYVPLFGHVLKPGAPGPDYVPEYWESSAAQEIFIRNPDAPPVPPEPPPPPVVGICPRPDWPYRDSHVAGGGNDAAVYRFKN